MMANTARPWRLSFTMCPNVNASANGMTRIAQSLDEVVERRRVLERVGGVHVEEAAAVGAELLDGDLAGDRAAGDELLGRRLRPSCAAVKPSKFWITPWLTSTRATTNDSGSRMRTVRAGEVDPEVADGRARRRARPRMRAAIVGHAGGRRHEVLHRQAHHLGEVAHRRLAAVGLPVRVGHEADRGVERQVRHHRRHVGGVERQRRPGAAAARRRTRNETMLKPSSE